MLYFLNEDGCKPVRKILIFDIAQICAVGLSALFGLAMYAVMWASDMGARANILRALCTINFVLLLLRIANHKFTLKNFDPSLHLPLHLCSFTVVFCLIAAYSESNAIRDVAFGLSPLGAIMAMTFPEADGAKYPRVKFRAIEYYYSHTTLILTPIFLCCFLGFKPSLAYFPECLACLMLMTAIAWAANRDTGGNYMYISKAPASPPLMYIEKTFGVTLYRAAMLSFIILSYIVSHLFYLAILSAIV